VVAQVPTEQSLMENDSVQFSASLNGMRGRRVSMRIPNMPIRRQMMRIGMTLIYTQYYLYTFCILHGQVKCPWLKSALTATLFLVYRS